MRSLRYILACSIVMACIESANAGEPLVDATPPTKFCDKGYFEVGGSPVSFAEVTLEGNRAYELNNKGTITAFGYIKSIELAKDPMEPTRAKLFGEGQCWKEPLFQASSDMMTDVDIAFVPQSLTTEEYKDLRMTLIKIDSDAFAGRALVKVTGSFENYRNTKNTYFSAVSLEIVDKPQ